MRRTHTCGELRSSDLGKEVCLQGWVRFSRDHGGVAFIDLADRYGITQVVFDPEGLPAGIDAQALANVMKTFTRESAVSVNGIVRKRVEGTEDARNNTGEVEVLITSAELLNKSDIPPFEIGDQKEGVLPGEDVRLEFRYLDLRRTEMIKAIEFRSKFIHLARQYLESQKFLEIETPMLAKSTPEGARDYVVPSRVHPGTFYALPQSPQLYKQMLMVAGMDRYYQVARCFRDEDSRKDRQPEFTQLDMEMSFVDEKDIQDNIEHMLQFIWKGLYNEDLQIPFPRISYMEAMERYGSDKPDLRYGLPLEKLTEVFRETDYGILKKIVAEGGIIVGLNLKNDIAGEKIGRNDVDRYISLAKKFGLGGLTWMRVVNGELDSNIVKYFTADNKAGIKKIMNAEEGDLIFIMAGPWKRTLEGAGLMRRQLAADLGLVPENTFQFHWLVDCPMFEVDPVSGKKDAFHHPFVLPYDNYIVVAEVKGSTIVEMLKKLVSFLPKPDGQFPQVSGLKFTTKVKDHSVSNVQVLNGATQKYEPINPDRTYTIATTKYCVTDGGLHNTLQGSKIVLETKKTYNEVFIEYITDRLNGHIGQEYAKPQGRITVIK